MPIQILQSDQSIPVQTVGAGAKLFRYRQHGQEPQYTGTGGSVRSQIIPVQTARSGTTVFRYRRHGQEPQYSGTDGRVRSRSILVHTVESRDKVFWYRRYGQEPNSFGKAVQSATKFFPYRRFSQQRIPTDTKSCGRRKATRSALLKTPNTSNISFCTARNYNEKYSKVKWNEAK